MALVLLIVVLLPYYATPKLTVSLTKRALGESECESLAGGYIELFREKKRKRLGLIVG